MCSGKTYSQSTHLLYYILAATHLAEADLCKRFAAFGEVLGAVEQLHVRDPLSKEEASYGVPEGFNGVIEVCNHHASLAFDSHNADLEASHRDDVLAKRGWRRLMGWTGVLQIDLKGVSTIRD